MTETKSSFIQKIDHKITSLSTLLFSKKIFPLTLVFIIILFGTYALMFYKWFFATAPISSGPTSGARVILTQAQAKSAEASTIGIAVNLDDIQGVTINGLQVIAELKGTIPDDIYFTPKTIDGLDAIVTTIDHSDGSPVLKIAFLKPPTKDYIVDKSLLELGTLNFTKPASGTLTFDFSPTLNKVLEKDSLKNVMVQPENVSYSF